MDIKDLQDAVIDTAADHIKGQRDIHRVTKIKLYCLTTFACVLAICAAVVACFAIYAQQQTIIEQQYALNMQYAGLMDYVSGAEITTTTETIDGSGGGIAAKIEGDGNTIGGGN